MPWPELIGAAWACSQSQFELALGVSRQMQDHDPVPGPILQCDQTPEYAEALGFGPLHVQELGERLVSVGVQFDLGLRRAGQGRVRKADFKFDCRLGRVDAEIAECGVAKV